MIHGGLNINLKATNELTYNQCCLSTTDLQIPADQTSVWTNGMLSDIRQTNNNDIWLDGCWQCKHMESAGIRSFRESMIDKFGITKNLSGPQRIDLLFDRSCNLACRICGPNSSTYWEKHLIDNNLAIRTNVIPPNNLETITKMLSALDLSNLEMVQFCGGETLLGNTYWKTAQTIADLVPDSRNKIELGFQTNATQPIDEKYYSLIEKFKTVKFILSIDGVNDRFEYLRWPAKWNQMVDNILTLREKLPSNVMFLVQETTSCLNLLYHNEVSNWVTQNFNANREGDLTTHSTQLAVHRYLNINNITQEYVDALKGSPMEQFISSTWKENPVSIKQFITETEKFDKLQGQDWKKTFPEVANFYSRYFK
jgi:sulfatase maturation enzyme AslB (radical SAM superfamily)